MFVLDLLRSESLEVLDVSACGIEAAGGAALAEVLTSGSIKLKSLNLNLSNNDFNETSKIKENNKIFFPFLIFLYIF